MELREAALLARQRAALAGGPPPGLVRLDLQVDHGVPGQRLAHPLRAERPAPDRHHARVLPREQLEDELLLARAKGVFALAVEERLDRLAETPLELAVRVERLGAELGGQRASAGGLPGPHEADQHEGYARLQPIRSSYASSAARTSSMWSPPNFSR
jgi:hypothetical protein